MIPSDAPRQELRRAAAYAASAVSAQSFDQFYEEWCKFLHHLERVWAKCQSHFGRSPKWNGWKGSYERLRTTDPMLSYLRNARGADEHTTAKVAANVALQISPFAPDEPIPDIFFRLTESGDFQLHAEAGRFQLVWRGGGPQLVEVKNRGVTYQVPTSHLGTLVDPCNVVQISAMALRF